MDTHGLVVVDKSAGMTSHDVVARVRNILPERAVGHLGTLDPAAAGLLVLAVGKKTLKVVELFENQEKTYEARIAFGAVSRTYDREGPLEHVPVKPGWKPPSAVKLREVLERHFLGTITQIPPAYSAIHIEGKRAYEVIRERPAAVFVLQPRTVRIASSTGSDEVAGNCCARAVSVLVDSAANSLTDSTEAVSPPAS